MDKLTELQKWLSERGLDLAYVASPVSINYLTGYTTDPAERIFALIVFNEGEDSFIFCPALNKEEVSRSAWPGGVVTYVDGEDPWTKMAEAIKSRRRKWQKWALEAGSLPLDHYWQLRAHFAGVDFHHDLTPRLAQMRLYKRPDEVAKMKAAGAEADFAFEVAFAALRLGASERDLAAEIEYQLKVKRGVLEQSFPTIVQAGQNAANASLIPTTESIEPGNLVIFDLGTMHQGYASDATRTVAFGQVSQEAERIYQVVQQAQAKARNAARPGMTTGELDAVARDVIEAAGYGQYFIHRLGHGIGMQAHEFLSLAPGTDTVLEAGMCFSIEPGIYLPGVTGARIEDCGLLTKQGFEPFTNTSRDLRVIPAI
jgi:Xaa-Pro dipeptidase